MKYVFVIAIAVLALFYFVPITQTVTFIVGKEAVHAFSGRTSDVSWVETDTCPPWCNNGCKRQAYSIVKLCK